MDWCLVHGPDQRTHLGFASASKEDRGSSQARRRDVHLVRNILHCSVGTRESARHARPLARLDGWMEARLPAARRPFAGGRHGVEDRA